MELLIDIKLPKQRLVGGRVPHKGCKPTMLDLNNYGLYLLVIKVPLKLKNIFKYI